jgi:hypothetical protein
MRADSPRRERRASAFLSLPLYLHVGKRGVSTLLQGQLDALYSRSWILRLSSNAGLAYAVDQIKKLPSRAAKSIKLAHNDDIAGSKPGHKLRQLRAISASTADFLAEGRASAGGLERYHRLCEGLDPRPEPDRPN